MGKLIELHALIEENTHRIRQLLSERSVGSVLGDYYMLNAVLHMLQVSVQALAGMGARLIAERGEKPPGSYSEVSEILEKIGVLSGSEASVMKKAIGFRNIVVHGYTRVSLEILEEILSEGKYAELARKMLLKAREQGVDC